MYKSRYPINVYILLIAPAFLAFISYTYQLNIIALLIYLPIGSLLFYTFFSRYSSRIQIVSRNKMEITYFFPWNKNVIIDLKDLKYINYGRGFYAPFSKHTIGHLSLLRICYDLIILSDNETDAQLEIKINTRMFAFKQLINCLEKDIKLKKVRLKGSSTIIW